MVASDAILRGVPQVLTGFEGPLHAFDLSPEVRPWPPPTWRDVWVWDLPTGRAARSDTRRR